MAGDRGQVVGEGTDEVPGTPSLAALTDFAMTACRLQLGLLAVVHRAESRSEADLPAWSMQMYDRIRETVARHSEALQRLVPDLPPVAPLPAGATWSDVAADELSRALAALSAATQDR
jgi:hypothetical protein